MPQYPDPDKIKKSVFPSAILKMINENTNGGFVLVYIDSEGVPQVVIETDNQILQLGMVKFCAECFCSLDEFSGHDLDGGFDEFNEE